MHEGNIRRVTIQNVQGKELIEIPLTWGVVGALLLPVWAAIGTVAALASECQPIRPNSSPTEEATQWKRMRS